MTRVLVTGGTGVLGRALVQRLQARGATVRVLSRRRAPAPGTAPGMLEWVQGDLVSGAGLTAAFEGVDSVVHSASSQKRGEEVQLMRQVIASAREAGVGHTLYVSIVGIDELDAFRYYAEKAQSEQLLASSGLPFSIQRATQFHDFVAYLLTRLGRGPLMVLPRGTRLQPVEAGAVAARLAVAALAPAAGRLRDLAGPEVYTLDELARRWLAATGRHRPVLPLPVPLPLFRALASGQLTSERAERIGDRWTQWLAQHATQPNPYQQARGGA